MTHEQILSELESAGMVDIYPDSWGNFDSSQNDIECESVTIYFDVNGYVAQFGNVTPYHSQDPAFEDNQDANTTVTNIVIYDDDDEIKLPGEQIAKIAEYINTNIVNPQL